MNPPTAKRVVAQIVGGTAVLILGVTALIAGAVNPTNHPAVGLVAIGGGGVLVFLIGLWLVLDGAATFRDHWKGAP